MPANKNIGEVKVENRTLTITVPDLDKDFGPSSSGKTNIVATGKIEVEPGCVCTITVYRYRKLQ